MRVQFTDALLYDSASVSFFPGIMTVENGRIVSVSRDGDVLPEADCVISLGGRLVSPGLVDVHTHGRAGYDFTSADEAEMRAMARAYAESGVTALMPTLASADPASMRASSAMIADLRGKGSGGARFLGAHVEGRYLNPGKRGAHAPALLAAPDADELEKTVLAVCPPPVHVSAAYELDRDGSFLSRILSFGGTAGLAHTGATLDEAMLALDRGVTAFTHLFNTMPPLHHRDPGPVCAALTTDAYVEVICDGMHVHPRMVRMAYAAKKRGKFVLITDSMEATGCPAGEYTIAGMPVTVRDGRAVTHDGALAGSLLSLHEGVANLMRFAEIPFGEALLAATRAPADMVGADTVGDLLPGRMADFLVYDADSAQGECPAIAEVWIGGERFR